MNDASLNDIQRAECISRKRAIVFYMLAGALILSTVLHALETRPAADVSQLVFWLLTVFLTALNLTPLPGWFGRRNLYRLLNDDTTQDHRRTSLAAGFWAAILSALGITAINSLYPVAEVVALHIVITNGLAAALISFATQELRAAR